LFPTAYAQSGIQKIAICEEDGSAWAPVGLYGLRVDQIRWHLKELWIRWLQL
jgi:hypothetical protein